MIVRNEFLNKTNLAENNEHSFGRLDAQWAMDGIYFAGGENSNGTTLCPESFKNSLTYFGIPTDFFQFFSRASGRYNGIIH